MNAVKSRVGFKGLMVATVEADPLELRKLKIDGPRFGKHRVKIKRRNGRVEIRVRNAFVNTGLNNALDRLFGLGGTAIGYIGVSSDNTAVTASSTTLGGTVSIKALTTNSRSSQTVTAGATFTQADVSFSIRKVGLLNTATDAGTGLIDVIGGAGSSPYNKPFTIDLTSLSSFSLTLQIQVTAVAV